MKPRTPFLLNRSLGPGLLTAAAALALACGAAAAADPPADEPYWQAGLAREVITPQSPMWLSGYAGRDRPAEGKVHDLYARAAALRDPAGKTAVFVSLDLIGVPVKMAESVSRQLEQRNGLSRAGVMFASSHTHCGPALDHKLSHMLAMDDVDWDAVRAYQQQLDAKVIRAVESALADLQPVRLSVGRGDCRFAANRRPPIGSGPIDHEVPVLVIESSDGGTLRGVIFGYACHNTTLSFYQWCGDYAGFAEAYLEDRHPGAVALFFAGCGGDQNPLPRRKVELAEKYGRMLGLAVERAMSEPTVPVRGRLRTSFDEIPLAFDSLPDRDALEEQSAGGNRFERARAALLIEEMDQQGQLSPTYPYPIQVWMLGSEATWVALGGEVVVDYALRIKSELAPDRAWVTAYANDVMGYIPSERVLREGGYEGGGSMLYYQLPSKWKSGLEDQIIGAVRKMAHELKTLNDPPASRRQP